MEVIIKPDYEKVCAEAAAIILEAWKRKNDLVLGLATGKTPVGLYEKLVVLHQKGELDFSSVVAFNLDEYLGLGETHPQSYAHYMDQHLLRHVNIRRESSHHLDGRTTDIEEHCRAYEEKIKGAGGIDVQILGIGKNGHIAFNEPGSALASRTRLKILTRETVEANRPFFKDEGDVPRFCLTMGIGTILETKMILLLASGKDKAEIVARAIEGPVTAALPASALQFHPRAKFILDEAAAAELTDRAYYRWAYENKAKVADLLTVTPLRSKS
ncbi:MAG: glucosamine-6-phosphate deaminase [Candidatus Aminicenantales bacterium]